MFARRRLCQQRQFRAILAPDVEHRTGGGCRLSDRPCRMKNVEQPFSLRRRASGPKNIRVALLRRSNEGAGTRTLDLRLKRPLLYQLSYALDSFGVFTPLDPHRFT